ncbi:MAG: oligosaccharide flippase family protein [Tumebacillaceae bacterium]
MVKPFPIRESSILSLAELVSRLLGLMFLAHFVTHLGLQESATFRMTLPLVGIAAAFGSIGLPQALTRLFASTSHHEKHPVPRRDLQTALAATLGAAAVTALLLTALSWLVTREAFDRRDLARLLEATAPLLLLMCATGSLRGILLGLGSTYAPALAQVLEVATRLTCLLLVIPFGADSAQAGLFTMTIGEAVAGLFLAVLLFMHVQKRGLEKKHRPRGDLLPVLRMALAPTGQALLASLGYALELPLAQELLARTHGTASATAWIGEYAAIALPLLCAPMVFSDGIATALLPVAAAERAHAGFAAFSFYLRRAIGAVAMIALPATGALLVLAPTLTAWFDSASAGLLLVMLAPLTLPLYLQAPLSALLQAQGHSRALLTAGLCGDAARLGGLWLFLGASGLGRDGLALAFACSVLIQTSVLLVMAARIAPLSIPWQTLFRSLQAALGTALLLLFIKGV